MRKWLFILMGLGLMGCLASAQKLVIKGSDTLGAKLMPLLAEAYKRAGHDVKFEIAAEGSTTGLAALLNGAADIGMSSRPAKTTEISEGLTKKVELKPAIVAYDAIALIVNTANPLKDLTRSNVEAIFTGEVTDWEDVGEKLGEISVYTRNTSSGTYQDWKDLAMNKRDYAQNSQKLAGNEQIVSEVSKNPMGVGYVGLAYAKAKGVKILSVDGIFPSAETVKAKTYPYVRPLFFYTNGDPKGETKKFIDFVLGPEGQKIVKEVGFVSVI